MTATKRARFLRRVAKMGERAVADRRSDTRLRVRFMLNMLHGLGIVLGLYGGCVCGRRLNFMVVRSQR